MTVQNPTNVATFTGNGVTTVFPYTFFIPGDSPTDQSNVEVTLLEIATGVAGDPLADGLWSITGVDTDTYGNVTYTGGGVPLPATHKINIRRVLSYEQELDLTIQSGYFPQLLEAQLDNMVFQTQQLAEEVDRAVKVSLGSGIDPNDLIADLTQGSADAVAAAAAAAASEAAAAASAATALAAAASTDADVIAAAASADAAAASAAAAAASATSASGSATTATTKAAEASTSATAAAASATTASTAATNATTAKTAAELAETHAETAETNAGLSATAAAASAAAAAASAGSLTPVEVQIHAAAGKTTPIDADELGIVDTAAANALKKLTFANLSTWVGTKLGPLIAAATGKTTPIDADTIVISDSAASDATKKVTLTNFKAFLKTYFDTLYAALGSGGVEIGTSISYHGHTAPAKYLFEYGQNVSRTTYSALKSALIKTNTCTLAIASPGVVHAVAHGINGAGAPVRFYNTGGALPTGLTANTTYYVISTGFGVDDFRVSATVGGVAINFTGSQSGVHTVDWAPHGFGDGSTTFGIPDSRGRTHAGRDDMGGTSANRVTNPASTLGGLDGDILGNAAGAETHTVLTAQMPSHTHTMYTNTGGSTSAPSTAIANSLNTTATTAMDAAGSGTAHNNMPPTLITNKIIYAGV